MQSIGASSTVRARRLHVSSLNSSVNRDPRISSAIGAKGLHAGEIPAKLLIIGTVDLVLEERNLLALPRKAN